MKKMMTIAMAVMVMSLASCGNTQEKTNVETDTEAVPMDSVEVSATDMASQLQDKLKAKDRDAVLALSNQIQQKIADYIVAGDTVALKTYVLQIQNLVQQNSELIKSVANGNETILNLVNVVNSADVVTMGQNVSKVIEGLPADVKNGVASAAKQAADNAKSQAEQQANAAVEQAKSQVKQQVDQKVEKGKAKVNEKVEEGKAKLNQKATEATNSALKKLGL